MQGKLGVRWLDETDCVGAWESDAMAAVVLPTANTLPQLRDMAAAGDGRRLLLVVNPQWQMDGQIVSDFGCVCFQNIVRCTRHPLSGALMLSYPCPLAAMWADRRREDRFILQAQPLYLLVSSLQRASPRLCAALLT